MTYKDIIKEVAENNGIEALDVHRIYRAYWKFIRETIKELPLKNNLTKAEFSKLRTNFNIPSLGKLVCTYDRYKSISDRLSNIKNIKNRNEEIAKDKTPV